jgi:hypothetical protein
MVNWSSLGILELRKYCEYYQVEHKNLSESQMIKKLSEIDDNKFVQSKETLSLEQIFLPSPNKLSTFHKGSMYQIHENILYIHNLQTFSFYQVELQSFEDSFEEKGLFVYEDVLYYYTKSIVHKIDKETGSVDVSHFISNWNANFVSFSNGKIWFSSASNGFKVQLSSFDMKKEKLKDHPLVQNLDFQGLYQMGKSILYPDVKNLNNFTRFHLMDINEKKKNKPFFESMLLVLEKIVFGAYYSNDQEVFIAGGLLHHYFGHKSNEVHIFNFQKHTHQIFYLPFRMTCEYVYFYQDYFYFFNCSVENNQMKHFRCHKSKTVHRNFQMLLQDNSFSDISITVQNKEYHLHKFILEQFTILDLSKSNYKLDGLTFYEMEYIIDWMYSGETFMDKSAINVKKIQDLLGIHFKESPLLVWVDFLKNFETNFSDVKIICNEGNSEFMVHKAVLSLKSNYFKSLFSGNYKDSNTNIVELNHFSEDDVLNVLKFFYLESMEFYNVKEIIHSFEIYLFLESESLGVLLWSYLEIFLDSSNCFMIYDFCEDFCCKQSKKIRKQALKLIEKNYKAKHVVVIMTEMRKNLVSSKEEFIEVDAKRRKIQ